MKKTNKILISVGAIMFIVVIGLVAINFAKYSPTKYLNEKYGIDRKNFQCVEYSPKHYFVDFDHYEYGWTTPMWIYKYENNEFIVKKIGNEFRDDFQFNEFINWSIDFFNQNTEYNVKSINLKSNQFFEVNKILNEKDFKEILYDFDGYTVYIETDNIDEYINNKIKVTEVSKDLKRELSKKASIDKLYIFLVDKSVAFENKITYYNGDRNYISEYSLIESPQNLQKDEKMVLCTGK